MSQHLNQYQALAWVNSLLKEQDILFLVTGCPTAKSYGAGRPLHDIDLYAPGEVLAILEKKLEEYTNFGPGHYKK